MAIIVTSGIPCIHKIKLNIFNLEFYPHYVRIIINPKVDESTHLMCIRVSMVQKSMLIFYLVF
jgi:hypothetical protein